MAAAGPAGGTACPATLLNGCGSFCAWFPQTVLFYTIAGVIILGNIIIQATQDQFRTVTLGRPSFGTFVNDIVVGKANTVRPFSCPCSETPVASMSSSFNLLPQAKVDPGSGPG